jgi:hypothetical protein
VTDRPRIAHHWGGQDSSVLGRFPSTARLNDEHGTGGQTKLAHLLSWHFSTLWRKLNGKSRITQSDELAITQALSGVESGNSARFLRRKHLSK